MHCSTAGTVKYVPGLRRVAAVARRASAGFAACGRGRSARTRRTGASAGTAAVSRAR